MDILFFSIATIGPTFLVIIIGALLRKWNFMDSDLSENLSKLVFQLLLPALILKTLSGMEKNSSFSIPLVLSLLFFYFFTILIAALISLAIRIPKGERGFFMAGSSFGNNAIIGYAFGAALYGEQGIARAAILSAILMPLSLLSSGLMLNKENRKKNWQSSVHSFALSMIKNPVMISLLLGIALWLSPITLPAMAAGSLTLLAQASLPLALLAVGGSLEFEMNLKDRLEITLTTFLKLIFMPLSALGASLYFNLPPEATGSLLLMAACPTSISYFVMARNQGHSPSKGAAIVTVTTLVSALSAAIIAAYLKYRGWV
ncbi:AEC family transporter [Oceanispirochaeta crateris]|uniref:AEC family transporter n=1 Tax=Oceanispirochaeta crateris TaxID=2518645 RepID=A0A5C1QSF2_9SPIO|nr:AEC family transporter [Oceanispirochaeta crateris]QEN09574.1 AEC family transporter [Oceanispirochaeta crateris]